MTNQKKRWYFYEINAVNNETEKKMEMSDILKSTRLLFRRFS